MIPNKLIEFPKKDLKDLEKLKNKKTTYNNWLFNPDHVNSYAYLNDFLSKDECNEIINIAKNKGYENGIVYGKNPFSKVRQSNICWLVPSDNLEWVFRKLTDAVMLLNKEYFKFNLFGMLEGLQFTNYKSPSGKYGKHVDRAHNLVVRKLSISIQLTDPKEYKGGELCLYEGDKAMIMDKTQGKLVIFPSFMLHEVKPVKSGERNSLVAWVTGENFK